MARRIWPGENPIGKRIKQGFPETPTQWAEVVGVVNGVKQESIAEEEWMQTYFPLSQRASLGGSLVVRVAGGDPNTIARTIEKQLHVFNKDLPVYEIRKMEEVISGSLVERRFSMLLLAVFAGLALVLAAVGIYGLMAYTVAERRQEIGVRIALGASAGDIFRSVVSRGMMLVAAGLVLGTAASFGLTRFLATLLYEVGTFDPQTWAGVVTVLALSALAACLVPAVRALRVDPVEALRAE
jgi:putative ABC transport system permease protein